MHKTAKHNEPLISIINIGILRLKVSLSHTRYHKCDKKRQFYTILLHSRFLFVFVFAASTATKELDDLMASLSDFKVNTVDQSPGSKLNEGRSMPDGPPSPAVPSFQVEADYAKIEKRPPPAVSQKPKGKCCCNMFVYDRFKNES